MGGDGVVASRWHHRGHTSLHHKPSHDVAGISAILDQLLRLASLAMACCHVEVGQCCFN